MLDSPDMTAEKVELYDRYLTHWHNRPGDASEDSLREFLYDSPVNTLEFSYRDATGKLLAVGICDVNAFALSSVYFFFDPAERKRSLGVYGAVKEIEWARSLGIRYYYLGYYVRDCAAMNYKADYKPSELLGPDGVWRRFEEAKSAQD